MDYSKLADLLYPNTTKTIQDYFNIYPPRNLPEGAEVTRFAPSPTGYLHIGHFCGATTDLMLAKASNGIFYFRLEDTDGKRTIEGADKVALEVLEKFGIIPQEGYLLNGQVGNYGPYKQSERVEIYNTFAKYLVSIGRAYPCFCKKRENKEEILQERSEQLSSSNTIETKDACRDLSLDEVKSHLQNGDEWPLRNFFRYGTIVRVAAIRGHLAVLHHGPLFLGYQNLAGFGAHEGAHNPLFLHLVHNPGRPGVTQLQPALEHGHRGLSGF